ncbi:MDR family MFS transporter [Auraticoccus cholistanensis]|uniref:MDR family MFS transporter n=1 Tax=Auraticoccus cholistanensis TaxID=2656650 RepID=UPI002F90AD30
MPQTLPRPEAPPSQDTRGIIPILLLSAFVLILNETTMSVAVPRLMVAFSVDATVAQWLTTAFLLTMAVVIPLSGFLLQRLTTRTVFFLSLGLFSAGTLACALAPTFAVLLVGRIVQASGTAVMMPLLMTTVLTLVPIARRGRVMGNISIVIAVAPTLGPTASGLIQDAFGWRWVFGLVLPIALAMLVAGAFRLKNFGTTSKAPVDVLSVVLSAFGFGGLVYGLTQLGESFGGNIATMLVPLGVGVLALALFVLRQLGLQKQDRPLLDLRTFRSRTFTIGLGIMMVAFGALLGSGILIPIYLQDLRGLSPAQTGLFVMPGGVMMGLMGPLVGRLYDRVGPRVLVLPGVAALAALLLLFGRADLETPMVLLVVLYTVMMLTLGLTFTPTMTAALNSLPPRQYSHGSALVGTLQQVAGGAGTALLVTVMSVRWAALEESGTPSVQAHMGGIELAFTVAAVLALAAVALAVMLPGRPPAAQDDRSDDLERADGPELVGGAEVTAHA